MLTRQQVFPQSNLQPHSTLQSTRLHTPTTFGLCCLVRCMIIKDHRTTDSAWFQLWGTVMKDQRRINVKTRGFRVNINEPMNNEKAKNAKRKGKSQKHENHKVHKFLWNWFIYTSIPPIHPNENMFMVSCQLHPTRIILCNWFHFNITSYLSLHLGLTIVQQFFFKWMTVNYGVH